MNQEAEKIFIVDDDFSFRKAVAALLRANGYQVAENSGRLDVLKAIIKEGPDLILLDLRMSEINGEEILNSMRRKGLSIPVIVVSGSLNRLYRRLLNDQGVCDFLMKPAAKETLLTKIRKTLSSASSENTDLPESLNLY
jgi:FixJ family two-component response regulator